MEKNRDKIDRLNKIINNSDYLVCLMGVWISYECGCTNYRDESDSYDIEAKYGYSPDELFNAAFFNTRPGQFFEFYRNDMISVLGEIGEGLIRLRQLEESGKLKCTITRDIYSLAKRAGCRKVYELHGSVFRNYCQRCRRTYPFEYIKNSRGIPRCEYCSSIVRPAVSLVGEMVDNGLITRAAEEVQRADTLLVMGSTLKTPLTEAFLKDFEGNQLILINSREHYTDSRADLVIHGKPLDIMKEVVIQ